jgi:tRNA threonylcarbamoyladenosine biosynthesis protein TsaE
LTSFTVLHFDFYRIGDSRELEFIGIDELMDTDAIKLVEWPERAADRLPPPDLEITLRVEDKGRRVELEAAR